MTVPFLGLTGGIGAGKSTALQAFEGLGAATLSTDQVVHELYETDEVRDEIVDRFGTDVLQNGAVDRAAVARLAFATPDDRHWLEGLLWPKVGNRIVGWRTELQHRADPPRAAVVEVPLLFEAGMEAAFDATIAIVAPEALRAERAGARGHAAVDERTSRQLTQDEKARRATFTVVNDGAPDELVDKLSEVLVKLEGQ